MNCANHLTGFSCCEQLAVPFIIILIGSECAVARATENTLEASFSSALWIQKFLRAILDRIKRKFSNDFVS